MFKRRSAKIMYGMFGLLFIAALAVGCNSTANLVNPDAGPKLTVTIPELFSPDPDVKDDPIVIAIAVDHPVPIKTWNITVNRNISEQAAAQPPRQESGDASRAQRQRRNFYDQEGKGTPPAQWKWDGKRSNGEMVQSATDYRFELSVTDVFDNNATYEGIISVDVLVRREGNDLRIIVPSIVFPPNSNDFSLLSDDERRANARVLRLIGNALNKYPDYKITVEGHANPTTPPGARREAEEAGSRTEIGLQPLSQSRAQAVVDYLVANNGIDRSKLTAIGAGGSRTVAAYDDADENWKNRRVEFILQR